MLGTLESSEKGKVDIREVIKAFEENKYAYPHMKQLLNEEFFNKSKLIGYCRIY